MDRGEHLAVEHREGGEFDLVGQREERHTDPAVRARRQFGEQGTVELISTVGYYAMVGIFLKSFDVPTPTGDKPLK